MIGYVINEYGVAINYSVAVSLMDPIICEELHNKLAPCTAQQFFDEYCEAHKEITGETWELAKENPIY